MSARLPSGPIPAPGSGNGVPDRGAPTAFASEGPVPERTEHPRPLLRRPVAVLDGVWDFSIGAATLDRHIVVPFAPETPASGIAEPSVPRCWYRRRVPVAAPGDDERVLVHFGAVDRSARVWANGGVVVDHEGGYTPFTADVTAAARSGEVELLVRVDDPVDDLDAPRGKQGWR